MTKATVSSGWTGPPGVPNASSAARPFTHAYGQHQFTSDYEWMKAAAVAQDSRSGAPRIPGFAVTLLISPLVLWLARWIARSATGDFVVEDYSYLLFLPAFAAAGLAFLLSAIRSASLIWLRKAAMLMATIGVIASAAAYAYVTIKAHREAAVSEPERTFIVGTKDSVNFERENGSFVIGTEHRRPREYGNCVSVVLLTGAYGFSWVRVTEWVPRQRSQLYWPIRRQDCFSAKPLASFAS